MIELELSIQVLKSILYEDVSFKKALKNVVICNKSGQVKTISGLVGCELRHHLFFETLVKGEFTEEQKVAAYLALANHFFYKRINVKSIEEMINNHFSTEEQRGLSEILMTGKSPVEMIPYPNNTVEFASIRFNNPLWLTKMWKKHYGSGCLYKILKANSKPSTISIRLDKNIDSEEFLHKNKDVVTFNSESGLYEISSKVSYKTLDEYKSFNAISINPVISNIFRKYQNDLITEFSIYTGEDDSLVENCVLSHGSNVGINVMVPDLSKRSSLLRFIRIRQLKNINLFSVKDEVSMKCGISHKQEIIYCFPKSSSFNKIPLYPDYIQHIKRDDLDELISRQKEVLENCSKFVMEEGLLVYIVDTLSNKETIGVTDEFLSKHKEFELVEKTQHFPFESEKSSVFCAVFKLKGATND